MKGLTRVLAVALSTLLLYGEALARDIEVQANSGEINVYVTPNEPTQVQFPGTISGGFKKKNSALSLDKQRQDLIIFANQPITPVGEAFIIRLEDGRSYSLRIHRASNTNLRDDFVGIVDKRGSIIASGDEEVPAYEERTHKYAPPSKVSGFMRELVLTSEFGKNNVTGYTRNDKYKGQVILSDGTVHAAIDSIYVGPNLWGYVIETTNLLDQSQKINPATFRLDGTRAISASNWDLAPRPLNVEQQISGKHKTKIYIITRARN